MYVHYNERILTIMAMMEKKKGNEIPIKKIKIVSFHVCSMYIIFKGLKMR